MNLWTVCVLLPLWLIFCRKVVERRRALLNTALACAATFVILRAIRIQEATAAIQIPVVSLTLRWHSWSSAWRC